MRICMDPQDLNQAIKREHYLLLLLHANQGFWQIRLVEESSKLCTFNTPVVRYRFLRLPFGISSASEVFQRSVAQMIEGLDGVVNVIDDLLVWGDTVDERDQRLWKLLERARKYNLKFNRNKFQVDQILPVVQARSEPQRSST